MERRKFVLGLGALAAGGAAGLGTGAFDSVEADRDVSVELADDANAYLGLESESEYAIGDTDGTIELDFTGDNPTTEGGEHFNLQGITTIEEVFSVQNLGAQDDVEVEFDPESVTISDATAFFDNGTIVIIIASVASIQFIPENPQIIDAGEEVTYGVVVDHFADEPFEEDPQLEEFELTIEAETTNPGTPADSPPDLSEIDEIPDDRADRLQAHVDDLHYVG